MSTNALPWCAAEAGILQKCEMRDRNAQKDTIPKSFEIGNVTKFMPPSLLYVSCPLWRPEVGQAQTVQSWVGGSLKGLRQNFSFSKPKRPFENSLNLKSMGI